MAAVHVTGGQPGRGKEIGSIKFQNSTTSMRNFFIHKGDLFAVTDYHKARSATGLSHSPARFLLPQVAQLAVIYIAYIRPFANTLYSQISGTQNATGGDYLVCDESLPNKSWDGKHLTRACTKRVMNTWE
jgi:hypothetical protein